MNVAVVAERMCRMMLFKARKRASGCFRLRCDKIEVKGRWWRKEIWR